LEKTIKVSASYLTKKYDLGKKKSDKAKSKANNFWALRGVSFEVYAGEAIGLIGTNGSGKSTLSNIISGSSVPTTGHIEINGITSIIAIKSALRSELTGRENIELKSLLSGMKRKEIDEVMEDIISFADLDEFIDQPLKNYSSGMKSRLGFSISVHSNPDILIIDEALSVGDDTFYQRCVDKIMDFKHQGKTIFFVSHSLKQIKNLCDRVLWIHEGEMKQIGPTDDVIEAYRDYVQWYKALPRVDQKKHKKKLKKERKTFDLQAYYDSVKDEDSKFSQEMLKEIFFPKPTTMRMALSTKILILILLIALSIIGIYYMSQVASI